VGACVGVEPRRTEYTVMAKFSHLSLSLSYPILPVDLDHNPEGRTCVHVLLHDTSACTDYIYTVIVRPHESYSWDGSGTVGENVTQNNTWPSRKEDSGFRKCNCSL
jgi:hypothetical protein